MSLNSDWCFQYYAFGKSKKDRICLNHVTWIAWNVKHYLGVCSKYRPCILDSWSEGGSRSAHNTHVRVSRVSNGIQILNCFSNMKSENCGPWRVNQWSPRWRTRTSEDPRTSKSYFPRAPIIKIKVSGAFGKEDDKKHREVMNPAEFSFITQKSKCFLWWGEIMKPGTAIAGGGVAITTLSYMLGLCAQTMCAPNHDG